MNYLPYAELVERGIVRNRMTLWRWIKAGRFPKPVRLGPNTVGWPEDEIKAYDDRIRAERDSMEAAE